MTQIFPAGQSSSYLKELASVVAVTAVDRVGNVSVPAVVSIKN
jgi:hypothetical protein